MKEKIYKVQMNSKGAPDFSTAVEIGNVLGATDIKRAYDEGVRRGIAEAYEADRPLGYNEEAISIEWINKHLEWLDNCDNEFAGLAKASIKAMVKMWKSEMMAGRNKR